MKDLAEGSWDLVIGSLKTSPKDLLIHIGITIQCSNTQQTILFETLTLIESVYCIDTIFDP